MRLVLKKFFEILNMLTQVISYCNYLLSAESDIIENIIQTDYWKSLNLTFNEKNITLPIVLYFDDYEPNNPLGSHIGNAKCGAVYLNLPSLPPQFQAKLENILLFQLFHSLDRDQFGNKIIFTKIIEELEFLETEGISMDINAFQGKIYFKLVAITGDNLGIHSLLGFVESFSAHFCCRFCLTPKNEYYRIFEEKFCELRTEENYLLHLNKEKFGIKDECVFNSPNIRGYHCTRNYAVDKMHDIDEGVGKYDVAYILNEYIFIERKFSLDYLNDQIVGLDYDLNERKNKPPLIKEQHLKTSKSLHMSASEVKCFIMHLPFMIGDIVGDENDELWEILILLKQLVLMTGAKRVHKNDWQLLQVHISEYLELISKNSLPFKPKHHHLIHYPGVQRLVGPLWIFSSTRNEGKHQEGKKTSKVSQNWKNVCKTIALKHQLILNYRFLSDVGNSSIFTSGPVLTNVLFKDLPGFPIYSNVSRLDEIQMLVLQIMLRFMLFISQNPQF